MATESGGGGGLVGLHSDSTLPNNTACPYLVVEAGAEGGPDDEQHTGVADLQAGASQDSQEAVIRAVGREYSPTNSLSS